MTAPDPLAWYSALAPRRVSLRPRGLADAGPPSVSGRSVAVQADAGYWELTLSQIPVPAGEKLAGFRAMILKMAGGRRTIDVPVWEHETAPWPLAGGRDANLRADEAYDDGKYHDDGLGFFAPRIIATLASAGELRDTVIYPSVSVAGTVREGMVFNMLGSLYAIQEIFNTSPETWQVFPPLRRDLIAGTELNFDRPTCRMVLVSPTEGDVDLMMARYGFVDMTFREAF